MCCTQYSKCHAKVSKQKLVTITSHTSPTSFFVEQREKITSCLHMTIGLSLNLSQGVSVHEIDPQVFMMQILQQSLKNSL